MMTLEPLSLLYYWYLLLPAVSCFGLGLGDDGLGKGCTNVDLTASHVQTIVVPVNDTVALTLEEIPPETRFMVLQVHTQIANLSLSSVDTFDPSATKTGHNIGLLTLVAANQTNATWYLKTNGEKNVSAMAHVHPYTDGAPIPGGCNQVFNIENDPSIDITYSSHWTQVWFQWANLAMPRMVFPPVCGDDQVMSSLTYDVYVYFLAQRDLSNDELMSGLSKMLTPVDVENHGIKALSLTDTNSKRSKSILKVLSQKDQGAVYCVVVTRSDTGGKASYISAVSYACDMAAGECSGSVTVLEVMLAIPLMVLGGFLLLGGHRYFKPTQFFFGTAFFSLLFYLLLSIPKAAPMSVKLGLSLTFGVLGGFLWLNFWHFYSFPMASVFLMGLFAGYLVSATLFFTPFGNLDWWEPAGNYAMAFVCVLLVFAVLLMAYTRVLSIVSCALVGSFSFLLGPALLSRSSLSLIFLNGLYHQTEAGFTEVKVVAPLNAQDIVLLCFWPIFAVAGLLFQGFRERHRPPFPLPTKRSRQRRLDAVPTVRNVVQDRSVEARNEDAIDEEEEEDGGEEEVVDERRGLLSGAAARPSSYQSVRTDEEKKAAENKNYLL